MKIIYYFPRERSIIIDCPDYLGKILTFILNKSKISIEKNRSFSGQQFSAVYIDEFVSKKK